MECTNPCCRYLLICTVLILLCQLCCITIYGQLLSKDTALHAAKKTVLAAPLQLMPDTSIKQVKQTVPSSLKQLLNNRKTSVSKIADTIPLHRNDSSKLHEPGIAKDSVRSRADTAFKHAMQLYMAKKEQRMQSLKKNVQSVTLKNPLKQWPPDSPKIDYSNPFKKMLVTRPAFRFNGGYVSYQFNYRSIIDTPYAEKDIMQHNVAGQMNVTVGGSFPLQIRYWLRQSNSNIFRNIADVQVSFSGRDFHNKLQSEMRGRLLAMAPTLNDSLLDKLYALKQLEQLKMGEELKNMFHPQKLIEANEILSVPHLSWKAGLPDSVNQQHEDSTKKAAAYFLDQYAKTKQQYDRLTGSVDSLRERYQQNQERINRYRQMVNGKWDNLKTARQWKNKLNEYGMDEVDIPPGYRWLMGVRNFSVGRSAVNYSELTAKNVSVNGLNFEYNSWYYLAASAGTVNYRFRDFVVNGINKQPQYLVMLRAGIGSLERNYFILSAFTGQKQLFRTTTTGSSTARISGISGETRWAVNQNTYVTAEVAKSIAPDFRNNPAENKTKLTLSDETNQAIALHVYSYVPVTRSRFEGFYKKTGANFQSFSGFQTNAAQESWYVKAEQNFFNRKFRVAGSLRKNEFSNPFIVQDYQSNTIFKSITASIRMRKWPVVTVGYQPLSQLTKIDDQLIENRFQTFNATLYHAYTVKQLQLATTAMLNKFYNNNTDSGFIYYNATNSYLLQSFFFKSFTANVGVSYTKNNSYTLQVLDGYVQPNLGRLGTVGVGIKINNLNRSVIKAGAYINANIHILKRDVVVISYEHGYLPGISGTLARNEMGSIQFIKTFGKF